MDSTGVKVDMTEKGWLEPLVITEEGDVTKGINERGAASNSAANLPSCNKEIALKEKEEHTGTDKNEVDSVAKMCLEHQGPNQQQSHADNQAGEDKQEKDEPECENMVNGQNRSATERAEQTNEELRINESLVEPGGTEDENDDNVPQNKPQGSTEESNSSEEQTEGTKSREEDLKQAHRLTPDFPEALYELLCTLQEGRRLNDQRCSFRLESGVRRRRCHSEPNTTKPANRVIFSSMTSLQREEFFELVATAQARRLDDQRAQLHRSPLPKSKSRSFRGSIKQLSFVRKPSSDPTPAPVPKEDLYNMILTTQAQGRLEDQRSRAPGPMDDEDFFSLLLRVQGGRMDEQRTELPCMLQT